MSVNMKRIEIGAMLCVLLMLGVLGCEIADQTSTAEYDVSGSWLYSDTDGQQSTWALVQSDDASIVGAGTDGEIITGSATGDSIYLYIKYSSSNTTSSLYGTMMANVMGGTYTNSSTGSGSWTAVKTN